MLPLLPLPLPLPVLPLLPVVLPLPGAAAVAGAGAAAAAYVPLAHTKARGEGKEEAENEKQRKQGNQLIDSAVESKGQLLQSAVHKLVDDSAGRLGACGSTCIRRKCIRRKNPLNATRRRFSAHAAYARRLCPPPATVARHAATDRSTSTSKPLACRTHANADGGQSPRRDAQRQRPAEAVTMRRPSSCMAVQEPRNRRNSRA